MFIQEFRTGHAVGALRGNQPVETRNFVVDNLKFHLSARKGQKEKRRTARSREGVDFERSIGPLPPAQHRCQIGRAGVQPRKQNHRTFLRIVEMMPGVVNSQHVRLEIPRFAAVTRIGNSGALIAGRIKRHSKRLRQRYFPIEAPLRRETPAFRARQVALPVGGHQHQRYIRPRSAFQRGLHHQINPVIVDIDRTAALMPVSTAFKDSRFTPVFSVVFRG